MPKRPPVLRRRPNTDPLPDALMALAGAEYHFQKLRELFDGEAWSTIWEKRTDINEKKKSFLQDQTNQTEWHMRAYFWELISCFDILLLKINDTHKLGIREDLVGWEIVQTTARKNKRWTRNLDRLEATWNSDWFKEVKEYRNFGHRGQFVIQADISEDGKLNGSKLDSAGPSQAAMVDVIAELKRYLQGMHDLVYPLPTSGPS